MKTEMKQSLRKSELEKKKLEVGFQIKRIFGKRAVAIGIDTKILSAVAKHPPQVLLV